MPGPRFVAPSADLLIAAPLGEVTALFHRPSAQTHVVAEPVPEILAALATPHVLDDLLARLGTDEREVLSARLSELEASGLVARI